MVIHVAGIVALTTLLAVLMFRPFLPGSYDDLAVTLSFMAQLVGFAGLLLVPFGVLWLAAEFRRRAAQRRQQLVKSRGAYFAIAALVAASLAAVIVSLPAFGNVGPSLGLAVVGLWTFVVVRSVSGIRRLKRAETRGFHPAPLYLISVPLAVLLLRVTFIERATAFSRNYVIGQSAALISDIEAYEAANGHYPISLASLWKDYKPGVIGVEQFHYEPSGEAYNVFFEQFTPQLDTREIVMYNKLDEQVITSHDSWILLLTPAELESARGFYAVNDAAVPLWKYFWFD